MHTPGPCCPSNWYTATSLLFCIVLESSMKYTSGIIHVLLHVLLKQQQQRLAVTHVWMQLSLYFIRSTSCLSSAILSCSNAGRRGYNGRYSSMILVVATLARIIYTSYSSSHGSSSSAMQVSRTGRPATTAGLDGYPPRMSCLDREVSQPTDCQFFGRQHHCEQQSLPLRRRY